MTTNNCLSALGVFVCSLLLVSLVHGDTSEIESRKDVQAMNKTMKQAPLMAQQYQSHLSLEQADQLVNISQIGLRKDKSNVQSLISILDNSPSRALKFTTLRALSRMGATEALPAFEGLLPKTIMLPQQDTNLEDFAAAARARLVAESEAQKTVDVSAKAGIAVASFYRELGMTSDDLNKGLAAYNNPETNSQGRYIYSTGPRAVSIEICAVAELADMVYNSSYQGITSVPGVAGINFQQHYPSALKMRLAPLSNSERLRVIIQELSHKTALCPDDNYEIQLAIDMGTPAGQAAAIELSKMDGHRSDYNQVGYHAGFAALFDVLQGVGDKENGLLITHFLQDGNDRVAYYARSVHDNVSQGIKRDRVPAY